MGCRVLELADDRAVLCDSVSETVFGPVFADYEMAEAFIVCVRQKYRCHPRLLTDEQISDEYRTFAKCWPRPDEEGDVEDEGEEV